MGKRMFEVEKLALKPVPIEDRQHWMSVTLIQAGFMISATSLWTGSLIVAGMPLLQTVIAGAIGYLIIVAICFVQGMQGSDLGVPSIVAATSSFGEKGSQWLVSSVCAVCTIGWFGINANICGAAFSGLLAESFGVNFPIKASIIIWGIIMFSTAVIGFNGLKYLNIIAVPLMIAVSVIGLYMALSGSGMETIKAYLPTGDKLSMIDGINIVIGGFIVGAVLPADYTRYQKKRVDVLKSSFVGIFPIGLGLLVAGALFGIAAGTEDLTSIFIGLGIPVLGLVSLILTTWPANGANVYSAGLDAMKVLNLDDKYRAKVTVACGLIGTIVGSFEIIFYFETFLIYLGMIIAPFAGVMIADYWIIGKGKPENWIPRDGIHWIGMIALALGIVTSIFIPWAIPSVNGIVISMLSYLLLSKLTTNKAQQK